jgi:hypothetical protein
MTGRLSVKELSPDPEQPKDDNSSTTRWRKKGCFLSCVCLVLIAIVLPIILVTVPRNDKEKLWKDISPISQLNATHVLISGAWSDVLVIAGKDESENWWIEMYNYNDKEEWILQGSIPTDDIVVESITVSLHSFRIAVGATNPMRFVVYEENDGVWKQYGDIIYASDIVPGISGESFINPNVILSSDGRTMMVSFQTGHNGDGSIHVLNDVNSLGGSIGGVWQRLGTSIQNLHDQDHGIFGTHTVMDGDGRKLAVASEHETTSVYEWNDDDDGVWLLTAEYDESPLLASGSLAISRDGSTLAVGSYHGKVDGSGELHILNEVWPWYIYNDESQWLINGKDGADYDTQSTTVQVSLSAKGDHVLIGRRPHEEAVASLQVYQFHESQTEWTSLGLPFGHKKDISADGKISLDISDDGTKVAAAIMGKVFAYRFVGKPMTNG